VRVEGFTINSRIQTGIKDEGLIMKREIPLAPFDKGGIKLNSPFSKGG
jgi:hypothetical protein